MILNELSLKNVNNEHDMIKMMTDFLSLCKKLKNEIKDDEFYYTDEIFYKNENKNVYTISDWLKSDKVAKREKQYFRMLINRSNIIKKSDFVESELFIVSGVGENLSFTGGLVSYELDDYIVSLLTEKLWEEFIVKAQYISIENEDREVEIKNCSSDKHIKQIIKIKREQQGIIISSGKELWEKREVLYPHLVFCDEVKEQLQNVKIKAHIRNIMKRIQILEDYFSVFDGKFDKNKVGGDCRDESPSVKKNPELRSYRKFKLPNNCGIKSEYFYWHIDFQGDYPGRIHFLPDSKNKKGIIGYIGKHLPTKKFQTI